MSDAAALKMEEISDFSWPISYRFIAQGNRGYTSWEISVDAPFLNGHHDESVALGASLWSASIATAISRSVVLLYYESLIHKEAPIPGIASGGGARGRRFDLPAPRDRSGVITFNTHHADAYGRRRHYLYGMPNAWQQERRLTSTGLDGMMGYAHLLAIGMHFLPV